MLFPCLTKAVLYLLSYISTNYCSTFFDEKIAIKNSSSKLTKAVRYRLCHISMAPKWSKYSVVNLFKNADCLSYQGGALPTEP